MRLEEDIASVLKRKDFVIPNYIKDGLRPSITLRPYQEEALKHFLCYETDEPSRHYPAHLLFHMATGSGKTVIMAALIIHLYRQGYRNFLFFVNSSNIVEKTKENFLTPNSSKYLFADPIIIDGKKINIREISNFDDATEEDINIHFNTIQGLHSNLNDPKENSVTYEDFENKEIILISDEAHHINALTKEKDRLGVKELERENSWEGTIQKIFNGNRNNFLLEFTATINMGNENIKKKYENKIIYDYPLKEFRKNGYSKEVILRRSNLDPLERMFQVIMFSQYRHKLAEQHRLPIKPVILMKSYRVAESKRNTQNFIDLINGLTSSQIEQFVKKYYQDDQLGKICCYFFEEIGLNYEDFVEELKVAFSRDKIINVNEASELENYQISINSLEDSNNEIRVVFAVDKLNEGWDVLNLFDIARLYETRTEKTTTQEAQLIGRGARYCPFIDKERPDEPREKRKYDQETSHPLKFLEELHYHCTHDSKYVHEIKEALREIGVEDERKRETLEVKDSFRRTPFYKEGFMYVNKRVKNENVDKKCLGDYGVIKQYEYPVELTTAATEEYVWEERQNLSTKKSIKMKKITLNDTVLLRCVGDRIGFYVFDNVKKYLPHIDSMEDLFNEIKKISVRIKGEEQAINKLSKKQKKNICLFVLSKIEEGIKGNSSEFIGTKKFMRLRVQDVIEDKHVYVKEKDRLAALDNTEAFAGKWYVYKKNFINPHEKNLVEYIMSKSSEIEKKYDEFYLVRNVQMVKLFSFETGEGFEPDFLLFAIRGDDIKESIIYQLFMEPKGEHIAQRDAWKEKFLREIKRDKRVKDLYENTEYKIIGLPFYMESKKDNFYEAFEKELGIE